MVAATTGRWSDFWVRLGSALILGPVALLALWQGGLAWDMLIAVVMSGLGGEWGKLAGLPPPLALPVFLLIIWLTALTLGFFPALLAFPQYCSGGLPLPGFRMPALAGFRCCGSGCSRSMG
jgi:CDP-diglyceride synthetase